ncbi:redoxin domain-containing protein, partial [Phenylobacterium sp.]|uniref:redoxin domain-containing protein n=1 Tax=Phenylobacterium sp. TaxID=1871053 RepID=UPI0038F6AC4C
MKPMFAVAVVTAAGVLAFCFGAGAPLQAADVPTQQVHDFQLTDHTRLAHQLYYYGYAPAIVLMTRQNGSGVSMARSAELQKIAAGYQARGVLFFLLDSNLADTRDAAALAAAKEGLTLPILMDEQQLVGEQLGVKREGEVFVINPKTWAVAYRGPVSNSVAALDAVLAGQPVARSQIEVTEGRAVSFPEQARAAAFARISYVREIAPILQEKCVSCHLTGGIGPFAMDSYEVVKGFSPMIRETIRTRRMPPYFADPHIGAFKNDQGLTPAETKTLVHWIEAGAPRGDGADPLLANAGRVAAEWPENLGKPDVVVDLPAFKVPASGLVEYQFMRVDNPFPANTWLKA